MAFGDTVGGYGRTGTDYLRPARIFGRIPFMGHPQWDGARVHCLIG